MANSQIEFMRKWLDESGYGLELRVAHSLMEHGGSVAQSVSYTDPIEKKLREGDSRLFLVAGCGRAPDVVRLRCLGAGPAPLSTAR